MKRRDFLGVSLAAPVVAAGASVATAEQAFSGPALDAGMRLFATIPLEAGPVVSMVAHGDWVFVATQRGYLFALGEKDPTEFKSLAIT